MKFKIMKFKLMKFKIMKFKIFKFKLMKFKIICLSCYKSVHNWPDILKSMIKKDNFIILYKLMMNDHV